MPPLIFVTGGSRSGKSTFAEARAKQHARVAYVATSPITDDEMAERIRHHRERRPAHWQTIEEQLHVPQVVETAAQDADCILVDCITLWITNLMLAPGQADATDDDILDEVRALCRVAKACGAEVIVVTNEVGCGIVPDNALSRRFRDLVGWTNQTLAAEADEVHRLTAGIPQRLK